MRKKEKGITLVALIITVIIMLILAGIAVNFAIGENGVLQKAKYAQENYEGAQNKEQSDLEKLYSSMLIATDDNAQITMSVGDLKTLIKNQLEEEIENKMCSPIFLTTASLPEQSGRAAGTYQASSSLYTKTNSEKLEEYLKYEEGKGWTVQKSGLYVLKGEMSSLPSEGVCIYANLYINSVKVIENWMKGIAHRNISHWSGNDTGDMTIYLTKGEVIDFDFVCDRPGDSNAAFSIYAMFQ